MCQAHAEIQILNNLLHDLKDHRDYLQGQLSRLRDYRSNNVAVDTLLFHASTTHDNTHIFEKHLATINCPKIVDIHHFQNRIALTKKLIIDLQDYILKLERSDLDALSQS